jgi:hypothetical protein
MVYFVRLSVRHFVHVLTPTKSDYIHLKVFFPCLKASNLQEKMLVVWQRWENLERIFFELSIIELNYSEKVKKSKKKIFFKKSFFHAFSNLWDSGKSAPLELGP